MGKYVLKDARIAINGTVISNYASSCELEDTADEIDFTGFSTGGYKEIGQGLHDATVTTTLFSDFAAGGVNGILQPLYASGGTFALTIRPTSSAISPTNPEAAMTARIYSYSGISGAVGDASTFDCSFRNAGSLGLVWSTA